MKQYDVIFLGSPVWLGLIPMPVAAFLEEYDFSGKTIVPFRTYGNHDSGQSDPAIKALCPRPIILKALSLHRVDDRTITNDISAWFSKIGFEEK
jgi:flavodoxin